MPKVQNTNSSSHALPALLSAEERDVYDAFSHRLADAAQDITLNYFDTGVSVEGKSGKGAAFDPVTEADRRAEQAIRTLLQEHFPEHGICGEEYGITTGTGEFNWVLDPIDGTRAFISALPVWGTLIALTRHGRPVLGIMDQPVTGERFVGLGDAAYLLRPNSPKRPLQARQCATLAKATISTTDAYLFTDKERPAFEQIRSKSRLQRYGLDCYGYASLARGGIDLVIESGLESYDIAALIPIVEGAGGIVTDWSGGTVWQGGQVLACGDLRIHKEALAILKSYAG